MKKKVLVDAKLVASFHSYFNRTVEDEAKSAERRAKEFNEFIRDHRSQDDIYLEVERIYQDQCEFCGNEWESRPACCNRAVEECEREQLALTGVAR